MDLAALGVPSMATLGADLRIEHLDWEARGPPESADWRVALEEQCPAWGSTPLGEG